MNIEDTLLGMQVRVKTLDELRDEGKISTSVFEFKEQGYGTLLPRLHYLGRVSYIDHRVEGYVSLKSFILTEGAGEGLCILWHPDLLVPVEGSTELESETDKAKFSSFLDGFVQK